MDIISRFKKDYVNYLISIILPAIITGGFVPLIKRTLGAEFYGRFAIFFYAALICASILSGWIVQSVLLFYNHYSNKDFFLKNIFRFFILSQLIIIAPVLAVVYWLSNSFTDAILFFLILSVCSLQSIGLAIIQASKKSSKNIYSEVIRCVLYLLIWILLFTCTNINSLHGLYISIILSYFFSAVYIYKQTDVKLFASLEINVKERNELLRKFLRYGAPFSLWFVFLYLFSYIDKIFLLKAFNRELQGNYQAMFDMIAKSITLILSPVLTTLFPLLAEAYILGEKKQINKILSRIISFELLGMIITSICYWLFGAQILFSLLKIPSIPIYKQMGLIIILGSFTWQIAMVAHKYFELKQMSLFLLKIVIIAFLVQLCMYLSLERLRTPLLYPIGYFITSLVYLFSILFFILKRKGLKIFM
jgi:O-antigen/teichoic acid export membrane protein